jgi:hypothetical protein
VPLQVVGLLHYVLTEKVREAFEGLAIGGFFSLSTTDFLRVYNQAFYSFLL